MRDEVLIPDVLNEPKPSAVIAITQHEDALTAFASPSEGIARAKRIATELASIVAEKKLSVRIGQGEHLRVEAWLTLGALCGLMATTAETKQDEEGFWARVQVIRLSTGEAVGAAESRCDWAERNWSNRDSHALLSMAQTRATSKALAQCLRWIVILAGYSGTPAEELSGEREPVAPKPEPKPRAEPVYRKISDAQRKRLFAIWNARIVEVRGEAPQGRFDQEAAHETLKLIIKRVCGVDSTRDITEKSYDKLVEAVEAWLPAEAEEGTGGEPPFSPWIEMVNSKDGTKEQLCVECSAARSRLKEMPHASNCSLGDET